MVHEFWFFYELAGLKKTYSDHCVFVENFSDTEFIIFIYVVDMLVVVHNSYRIKG